MEGSSDVSLHPMLSFYIKSGGPRTAGVKVDGLEYMLSELLFYCSTLSRAEC